jgi:hypothetical protein
VRGKWLLRKNVLVFVGVVAGIGLALLLRMFWDDVATAVGRPKPLTAQEIVAQDLSWADQESGSGLNPGLAPVHELFGQGRQGARAFAEDALSFESKWQMVTDYVASGNEHAKFLQEKFAKRVFSPEQLESAVESSVNLYMKHLENIESQLLVRLQADLSCVPGEQFAPGIDRGEIRQLLDGALSQARAAAETDFRGTVGREIASLVAGEILSAAAVELGASTGILGAGAVSTTMTFGAGLLVGVIADYAVSWAYDKLYDPVGELTKRVNQQLDQLEQMILVGNAGRPGLQQRLQDYSSRRSQAREAAIRQAILPAAPPVAL